MNFKISASLLVLALSVNGSFAHSKSSGRGSSTTGGSADGSADGGGHGPGGHRPFGGPHGDRPGFPGLIEFAEFTDIMCSTDYDCSYRKDNDGVFVCRQSFHPITGENHTRAMCIPSDSAWETDECGCCGEDCPAQPDFVQIACDDEGKDHHEVVCRELTNPFTGELENTTIRIDAYWGLDGDTCGCCDGACPEHGHDNRFPRPDTVNITCNATELITCNLPPRKHSANAEVAEEGLLVCRKAFNPITGESEQQPLCIPSDHAWSTDECGCCGKDCPELPATVEIECLEVDQSCKLDNGDAGVFVCRELFHPIGGEIAERSLCIPSDMAWVTDTCSCCVLSGCPVQPESGFASEDAQLVSFALEAEGSGAGDARRSVIIVMNIFVGMAALFF
jgi:hypothetical protein